MNLSVVFYFLIHNLTTTINVFLTQKLNTIIAYFYPNIKKYHYSELLQTYNFQFVYMM